MNPLLVGEANPYGTDPRYALYPYPKGASGERLGRLILGMPGPRAYLRAFDRRNLCPQRWSVKEARANAGEILRGPHERVVLLGSKVAGAFGMPFEPFKIHLSELSAAAKTIVILPHPSGLCRAWNEPGAFERARAVLRSAGIL